MLTPFEPLDYLETEKDVREFLVAAIEDETPGALQDALPKALAALGRIASGKAHEGSGQPDPHQAQRRAAAVHGA